MKPNKQLILLPKVHTNVAHILSDLRNYLKERHNFASITSKNGQSKPKSNVLVNHSSLNNIKVYPKQKTLMQRYKKIRQIEAPYRCMVENQRKISEEQEKYSPINQLQNYSLSKQKRQTYFRTNMKKSKSIENDKNSRLMFVIANNKRQRKYCKKLSYCLNLVPEEPINCNRSVNKSKDRAQGLQNQPNSREGINKPKSFLGQIKNFRRQTIKGFSSYEPWQINEQQNDFVY